MQVGWSAVGPPAAASMAVYCLNTVAEPTLAAQAVWSRQPHRAPTLLCRGDELTAERRDCAAARSMCAAAAATGKCVGVYFDGKRCNRVNCTGMVGRQGHTLHLLHV